MMLRMLMLLCLLLTLPIATLATPVSFDVLSDPELDTGHWGGGGIGDCAARWGCRAAGTLYGDLEGDVLSNLSGEIFIRGVGSVSVTDGMFDFGGTEDSWFSTDALGGFDVGAILWNEDGLRFQAQSWDPYCQSWGCKRLRLRFRGRTVGGPSVPEPNAALLFGLGAVAVSRRVARR